MAPVNTLKRSRRAMQLNLLLAVVFFAADIMVMVVAAVDAHWVTLTGAITAFFVLVAVFGPLIYKLEQRPHHKVRLHRAIGVVDIDVSQPFEVESSFWGTALKTGGRTYPVLRSVGTKPVVHEWLRRAAR